MSMLTGLRVQMPSDSLLISTGDGAFDLFAALTLPYVAREARFLLRRAIFAIADRD